MKKNKKRQIPFTEVIQTLLDTEKSFPPSYLHSFSDLDPTNRESLSKIWHQINSKRKENLLEDLIRLAEVEMEVLFDETAFIALTDDNPVVRSAGIRLLWECNDIKLVPQFLHLLLHDPDVRVRASAANALGLFVYLGELEEIDQDTAIEIEDALISVFNSDEPTSVKLRVLESLGYSSRQEVAEYITHAINSGEKEWISSALFAMGRSADAEKWKNSVLSMLNNPILDIQFEAVQAAGMLELADAREPLLAILDAYDENDENVRMAAVTALSKIGGEDVEETLEALLEQVEDENEIEIVENALEYLDFFSGELPMGMFGFNEPDEDMDLYIDSPEDEDDDINMGMKSS